MASFFKTTCVLLSGVKVVFDDLFNVFFSVFSAYCYCLVVFKHTSSFLG